MTKRIQEAGTIAVDKTTKALRVCLITEGKGSSADFDRSFFVQENADALAESLSFPAHPIDPEHPEQRNPLSAIGSIGKTVTIEEHDGKMGFWSEFIPAKSKPEIGDYLIEFGHRLGLSIFADSEGYERDGRWVAESLNANDPYKSVDLVIAAGRGGKFERVAESLGLLTKTSATAGEKEVPMEIKDVENAMATAVAPLTKVVEGLVTALEGKVKADLQIEADDAAVEKIVESRFEAYDAGLKQIAEAKLTESQSDEARAILKSGGDLAPFIEKSQKILAEALALAGDESDDDTNPTHRVTEHLGDQKQKVATSYEVPGFGKVR